MIGTAPASNRRLSRAMVVAILLAADGVLIVLDNLTGPFLPFTVFYIALMYFAMTRVGSTWAYLIALLSSGGRTYVISQSLLNGAHPGFIAWQFATIFSVLGLICFLLDRRSYRPRGRHAAAAGPAADERRQATEEAPSRRTSLLTGQTDRYISLMILVSLGFLAAFVPWIRSSNAPEPYCMNPGNGKIIENPQTARPTQADVVMRTKVLLLTIDDGPHDFDADASILDTLDRHLAKSIWFITCRGFDPAIDPHADRNLQTLRRLVKDGHIIANHGYNHLDLGKLQQQDPQRMQREITQCSAAIRNAVDVHPLYFRAPFGDFPPESIHVAAGDGMSVMRWNASFDSLFQFRRGTENQAVTVPAAAMKNFVDQLQNGDIVLIHDTRRSANNLEAFLSLAEEKGFTFVLPGHRFSDEALAEAVPRLGDEHND